MTKKTTSNPQPPDDMASFIFHELPVNWKMMLITGVAMIIAGTLGLGLSFYLTLGSILMFGFLLLISGIVQIVHGIRANETRWQGKTQHFLVAVMYLLAAVMIIWDPILASFIITIMLAITFAATGAIKINYALRCKSQDWHWVLPALSGLLNVILSALILFALPAASLWLIGILIAFEMLINGWFLVFLALRVKKTSE